MKINHRKFSQQLQPTLKSAGRFILLTALTYGPGGLAGFAIKTVARRPLKIAFGLVLQALLKRIISKVITPALKHTKK